MPDRRALANGTYERIAICVESAISVPGTNEIAERVQISFHGHVLVRVDDYADGEWTGGAVLHAHETVATRWRLD